VSAVRRTAGCSALAALALALALASPAWAPGAAQPDAARAVPAPPALPRPAIGITANSLDDATGPIQDAARRLGVGWIREELRWSEVEPVRGTFVWTRFDGVMLLAAQRHLRVLPLLIRSPRWLTAHPMMLPSSLARWGAFVRAAVSRYGPGGPFWRAHPGLDARLAVRTWEIWNEPYLRAFSYPAPDPARYASVVRAAVHAGRRAGRGARFLMAAETSWVTRTGRTRSWIDDLFAAAPDLGSYVDAVAVHPYTQRSPDDDRPPAAADFGRIDAIRAALAAHGLPRAPLWITEIGWSTCSSRPPCVLPRSQARYLRRMFRLLDARYRSVVAAVFLYRLTDIGAAGPADPESGFGLITLRGARKPAWSVVARAAADRR
jgi:hypothetical protein